MAKKPNLLYLLFTDDEISRLKDVYNDACERYAYFSKDDAFAYDDRQSDLEAELIIILSQKVETIDEGIAKALAFELFYEFI